MTHNLKKIHVFSDVPSGTFLKQSPHKNPRLGGFEFSFGLTVPDDAEALIVFNRASYTIGTYLPKDRTAFIAAEPDAIHPYATRYLNQFGLVLSATTKPLDTQQWKTAPCWYWFAGVDYNAPDQPERTKGFDYFAALETPKKQNKVSVVTSTKSFTEYHRKRIAFLDALIEKIPDHLEIYGRGNKSIGDKREALLPAKYHIALENSFGPDTWTEKLADPLLCWAFPFYAGATNIEDYFPADSFAYVDIGSPEAAAAQIVQALDSGLWDRSQAAISAARQEILKTQNIMAQFVALADRITQTPLRLSPRKRYIKSERSLWPEKGARGSVAQWAMRNTLMLFDNEIELKTVGLRGRIERARTAKRARKLAQIESSKK